MGDYLSYKHNRDEKHIIMEIIDEINDETILYYFIYGCYEFTDR